MRPQKRPYEARQVGRVKLPSGDKERLVTRSCSHQMPIENQGETLMNFVSTLGAVLALAQNVPFLGEGWTMFCNGEKATGFDYRAGQWVETTFNPKQYVLTRKPDSECDSKGPLTIGGIDENFITRETCVNVKRMGDEESFLATTRCTEYYVNDVKTKTWSRSVSCRGIFEDFTAEFDGEFLRQTDSTIMRAAKTRDSLVVEVGKCALLNR